MDDEDAFSRAMKSARNYAPYFRSRDVDKRWDERGVVGDWLMATSGNPAKDSRCIQESSPDPPDVVVIDEKGEYLGIEVTEFILDTQELAYFECLAKKKGGNKELRQPEEKEWDELQFRQMLQHVITKKAEKPFKNCRKWSSKILLIFSDDPCVAHGPGAECLHRLHGFDLGFFDEVHFMIPPPPNIGDQNVEYYCRFFRIT